MELHNTLPEKKQKRELISFLSHVFDEKDIIEIRPIADRADAKTAYNLRGYYDGPNDLIQDLARLFEACKKAKNGLFYGILPRKNKTGGKKKNVADKGSILWADIDDKDTGGREDTIRLVNDLPLEPSAIIETGGGLHIYYYLASSIGKEEIEELNKKLIKISGGDKSAWNSDRILRLPLSWHLKGEPKKVKIQQHEAHIYHVNELRYMLKDVDSPKKQLKIKARIAEYKSKPIISPHILDLMSKHKSLNDYYHNRGKISSDQSGSAYDWIFTKELAYLGVREEEAVNALTAKIHNDHRHKNYDVDGITKKGKNQKYINRTIARAYARDLESPARDLEPSAINLGDRDRYPDIRLERYPDDYSDKYKRGRPIANLKNAHKVIYELNRSIKHLIRYNQFTSQLEFQGGRIADHHITQLRLEISWAYGVQFKKDDIGQMIEYIAHQEENTYHPVKDYLESLEFNSEIDEPLADLWLERFCTVKSNVRGDKGKSDNDYDAKALIREMGRAWLVSAVARIYEPGCKVDCSLIFLGKQGIGKSTIFRYLAKKDEWFSDSAIDIRGGKDSYSKLRGKWIYEFAELSSTKNRDSTVTKSFISSQSDNYRPAYARYEIDQKRQCVFAGSSNELEIFRDVTGDRRYYPIVLDSVKLEELKMNIDRIWAHAVYLYKTEKIWRLTKKNNVDYELMLAKYQEPFKATDSWMEAINDYPGIAVKNWTLKGILEEILDIKPQQQNRAVLMRLSGLLSGAGWTKKREYDSTTKKSRYYWKKS